MYHFSYITCFVGVILCFFPLILNLDFDLSFVEDIKNIPLEKALSASSVYAFSLVSGIAVSFPIVLELIADIYSGQRDNFHAVFSKWILLIALTNFSCICFYDIHEKLWCTNMDSKNYKFPHYVIDNGNELSDLKLDNDMVDIVEDLRNSTDIAVEILNDLLTYEKLTANILQLDQTVIAVQSFFRMTVRPFELQARSKNIDFKLISDDITDDLKIFGDLAKLRRQRTRRRGSVDAILDLSQWFSLALFSSENERIHHTIDNTPLTYLRIDVTDTGPGISK
eukprot:gene13290-28137_t